MSSNENHCSFVLLAEFHILEGAQLKYQFPQPLGVDESVLAMSMLPDGAETQLDDWTIFFLNQTPFNTISPVLALESPGARSVSLPGEEGDENNSDKPELLCVLNLVRTKHDKTLDRGAKVLALAICTRHPFIQIFKPVLLMALDDYLSDPSQDCLARLFDAVNSMDLSGAPKLTRAEKLVMRASERKDIFSEKLSTQGRNNSYQNTSTGAKRQLPNTHRNNLSTESYSSFEEGLMMRSKNHEDLRPREWESIQGRDRADTDSSVASSVPTQGLSNRHSPSDSASFSLGGSAVWVGDESGLEISVDGADTDSVGSMIAPPLLPARKRRSTDGSSSSSHTHLRDPSLRQPPPSFQDGLPRSGSTAKDTHFYQTNVVYKEYNLPIKMPISTFPEEVGDYSLIELVKTFSSSSLVTGPQHSHLHTNGPQTHPIIILFNALVTGKRIIFLGHRKPAGQVSTFVLSACALGSGCGVVLRGFIERAFPYANLNNRDEWENVPAYIAGVTNPIFEASRAWDLLLDIGTGSVTVAKDIHTTYPVSSVMSIGGPLITRTGTVKAEGPVEDESSSKAAGIVAKVDNNADNLFIEDIRSAIEYHYGESLVRLRFTEYVFRFMRLASRYEEEVTGSTQFGYPSGLFIDGTSSRPAKLGSGIVFNDESQGFKELASNAHRIEAWRKTSSYNYCVADFNKFTSVNPIKGFDMTHQLYRTRHAKRLSDQEIYAIMRTLVDNVKSYDQVVELLAYLPPHGGGLLYLAYGLFHQQEAVRETTVDLFNQLRAYPVGVVFLQALNHFQRYAYVRQAHAKEKRLLEQSIAVPSMGAQPPSVYPSSVAQYPPNAVSRSYSNSSQYFNGGY